jgi:polar amino acid transport system substrate-binding protein
MRRFAAIGMAVAIAAGLSACSSSSKPASSSTTPTTAPSVTPTTSTTAGPCGNAPKPAEAANFKPVVAGTLSVVTSLPGPGFWEGSDTDPTKVTSGYEYDIAKCMEADFGLSKLSVRNVGFDAIVAGSVTRYDVALSQISITPLRAKVVSFSTPYFQSNQGILMKAGKTVTTLAQAKKLTWGVQTATTAIALLKKIGVNSPHVYQQLTDAYTALEAGQVDAILIDVAINLGEAARSHGAFHVVAQFNQAGGPDKYGAILPKGSVNLGAVDAVFASLKSSGELKTLAAKDLTADPGTIPVIRVPST